MFPQWQAHMPDDGKKPRHPEINFLPPLDMILSFFKKKDKPSTASDKPQEPEEVKDEVKRIIERINNNESTATKKPEN